MSEVAQVPQLRFPEFSGEWEEKRFDSLYPTVRNGFVGVATPYYVEEGVPYLQGKNIKSGAINRNGLVYINESFHQKSKKSQLRQNDIVMVQSGHVGECAVITEEFEDTNCHALLVSTPTHDIDSKFYINYFYSKFGRKKIYRITTGNTIKHILSSDLKIQTVSNPSYQEQQKIAAFLTAVDSKIEQLSKKKALLGEYKKGLMQQIFSQAIRFKADDGSAFPVWEEKNIVELAKTSIGLVTSMTPYYVDKGVPLIRNNDIFQNKIRKEKLIRLDYEFDQLNKNRRLFTNDIVTVHTGNIGASAVIDEELNGCQGFATLNTRIKNQNEISSSFLCWYYNSTRNIKYALSMATGDGRSNYNLKDFNKATIPVPSLPEQTKIAAFLTAADNKIEQVGKQFDESKQFKKALLQQMFV